MVETRTYAEIVLVIALLTSLGVTITDEDAADNIYSCDTESIDDMYCFKLSKINDDGAQTRCYYNKEAPTKYKMCGVGWEKTTLEEVLEKEPEIIYKDYSSTNAKQWLCNTEECLIKEG